MWHYLVTKKNKDQGFNMLEVVAILTIGAALSGMTLPSIVNWYNQNQVKAGIQSVADAFKEAKTQARQQSKSCNIILNSDKISTNINGCLSSSKKLANNVTLATNITGTPPAVTFSYKGNPIGLTTSESTVNVGVIVISMADSSNYRQCLLISDGLGMMRTGIYQGNISTITQAQCIAH